MLGVMQVPPTGPMPTPPPGHGHAASGAHAQFNELLKAAHAAPGRTHDLMVRHAPALLAEMHLGGPAQAAAQARDSAHAATTGEPADAAGASQAGGAAMALGAGGIGALAQLGPDALGLVPQLMGAQGLEGMFGDGEGDGEGDGATMGGLPGLAGLGGLAGLPGLAGAGAGAGAGGAAGAIPGMGALLNAPVTSAGSTSRLPAAANARTVADVAARHGVPADVAVAMMLVESSGDNTAVGDGGTSFGLFQLNTRGMLAEARLTPQQAFDPATNANVALRSLARYASSRQGQDWGTIAAASQRPADPVGYAAKVRAAIPQARSLLGG